MTVKILTMQEFYGSESKGYIKRLILGYMTARINKDLGGIAPNQIVQSTTNPATSSTIKSTSSFLTTVETYPENKVVPTAAVQSLVTH